MSKLKIQIPEKLSFLFHPMRYKVAYGGRGSSKSWSFARALLIKGYSEKRRILCTREVQNSIKQSVHALISDQIALLGLGQFYDILDTKITGKNGTTIEFAGLAQQTVESIKSFEGIDLAWVEEARNVSKRSWKIFIPTIRKPGSEIWVTFNPELDTDETYQRFVENAPPEVIEEDGKTIPYCKVVKINYDDNPWFNQTLERERQQCQNLDPEDYDNIWLGKCKAAVSGAIYADEVTTAQESGRVQDLIYDPMLKVHVVFDMGWNDAMYISLVQRVANKLLILECMSDSHKKLDYYSQWLKDKKLNYGKVFLPHDAKQGDYKSGKSAFQMMEGWGWQCELVQSLSVEAGIKLSRMTFPKVFFDKTKAKDILNCLKRYRRIINSQTNEPGTPLHDEYSHGADNFRYICISADSMSNEDFSMKDLPPIQVSGWMG